MTVEPTNPPAGQSKRWKLPYRYNKYHAALDCYGVAALVIVLLYMFALPSDVNARRWSPTNDSMIANILSELIGIYVSVRLIDFIIRSNESRDKIRIRTVRLMRAIERYVVNIYMFRNGFEVDRLRREMRWADRIRPKRNKHLSSDEIRDVEAFYSFVIEFTTQVRDYFDVLDKAPVDLENDAEALRLLRAVEDARFTAEENILEETDEDDF
jgi:hypothetical protein